MAIRIKKSHRGLLRKALHVKKGRRIPASKLRIRKGMSKRRKKQIVFARNARKWRHKRR